MTGLATIVTIIDAGYNIVCDIYCGINFEYNNKILHNKYIK